MTDAIHKNVNYSNYLVADHWNKLPTKVVWLKEFKQI